MREAVGSSPSVSTTSLRTAYRSQRLFCKSHFSLILSQLLSESNPLSLGFDSAFYSDWGTLFVNASHVAADGISFAATFLQKSLLTHSVAAPFQTGPAVAGLRFGFFILKTNAVSHSLRRSSFAQKVTLGSPARLQAPPRRLAVAATCEVKVTSKFPADVFFATC